MSSIIDRAIELEVKAETNYREAARATSDPAAGKILGLLATEEARHADVLKGMRNVADLENTELRTQSKKWIDGVVEGGGDFISTDPGLLAVLRQAMELEKLTEAFYHEQAAASADEKAGTLFATLANMEKSHFLLIGSWVEYFNRPSEWIESAEFGVRDEY